STALEGIMLRTHNRSRSRNSTWCARRGPQAVLCFTAPSSVGLALQPVSTTGQVTANEPQQETVEHELLKPTPLRKLLRSLKNVCGDVGIKTWPLQPLTVRQPNVVIKVPLTVVVQVKLAGHAAPADTWSICGSLSRSAATAKPARSG